MKASELRIGNLIEDGMNNNGQANVEILRLMDEHPKHPYRPIPLTEEWLLRFGFNNEVYTNGGFLKWQKGEFKLLDRRLPNTQYHEPKASIDFVHQLQNLYFALTGEELVVKMRTTDS